MLCPLCGCVYDEPRMLACLHNFCINCLIKYCSQTTEENKLICPQCRMETMLGGSGLESLPINTFVKWQIKEYGLLHAAPIHSDTENENRELTKMSLSSTDSSLSNKNDDSIQGKEENRENPMSVSGSEVIDDSYNTTIDSLHNKYLQLQTKALQITYAIDSVNQSVEDWKENRCRVKEDIQRRSQYLQSLIRLLERKLISELDSSTHMSEIMDEVTTTKEKLQDTLKLTLHNIQFIRHLINTGLPDDIMCLGKSVLKMKPINLEQDISLRFPAYKVECSHLKQESHLEEVFGELSKFWKQKVIMSVTNDNVTDLSVDQFLSDNPADLTQSMYVDREKHTREKKSIENSARFSPNLSSTALKKRNMNDSEISVTGNNPQTFLNDDEKNIYLKYEMAKKNVEKRRRELAVKHMIENKSRSYDEVTPNNFESSDIKMLKDHENLNFNKREAQMIFTEKMVHTGSEIKFPLMDPQKEKDINNDQNTRRWSSDLPLMAAQVTMARSKVSAVLQRNNSVPPNTCENLSVSPTAKKRSPTKTEEVEGIAPQRFEDRGGGSLKTLWDNRENEKARGSEVKVKDRRSILDADSEKVKRMSRDLFQEIKENARRKSERWRSVSTSH